MKILPLTNINKFEKTDWKTTWPENGEMFWCETENTYHYQRKNYRAEGIVIKWEANPFEIPFNFDYHLKYEKK